MGLLLMYMAPKVIATGAAGRPSAQKMSASSGRQRGDATLAALRQFYLAARGNDLLSKLIERDQRL
jgi:hypothetical protein